MAHRFSEKPRSVKTILAEIKEYEAESEACPWCNGSCWCDGGWSPEARLITLREELAAVSGDIN